MEVSFLIVSQIFKKEPKWNLMMQVLVVLLLGIYFVLPQISAS